MDNRIRLSDVARYCKCCNHECNYYFNTRSLEFERTDEITKKLGVEKNYFQIYYYDYDYIPLPVVDEESIIRTFISELNNKKLSRYFDSIDDENLWISFDKLFPCGMERRSWNEYYKKYLKNIALSWCDNNHIPYVNDM